MKVPVGNNHSMYDIQADNATTSANYPDSHTQQIQAMRGRMEELKECVPDRET